MNCFEGDFDSTELCALEMDYEGGEGEEEHPPAEGEHHEEGEHHHEGGCGDHPPLRFEDINAEGQECLANYGVTEENFKEE